MVTEVTARILKKPETARALLMGFPTTEQAGDCVAAIIANGIIPGGLEMMDRPAIVAAEDFCHPGYPLDVEGLLICELDGPAAEVEHLIEVVARSRASAGHGPQDQPGRGGAAALLARAQVRLPMRSAASRPTTTAWTAPSRAPSCPWCSPACAR